MVLEAFNGFTSRPKGGIDMHHREVLCFLIIDHDRKLFNVIESGNNIGWWNQRIKDAKNFGRDIMGYGSEKHATIAREDYEKQFGYTYTKDSVLLPYK